MNLFAQNPVAAIFDDSGWREMGARIVAHFPLIVTGLVVVLIFWIAARFVGGLIARAGNIRRVNADAVGILASAVRWTLITIGLVTGLGTVGVDISALVAGLGLTGLALGIALKDVVSNVIAGILILIYKPFQRHDKIQVTALEGVVTQIDLRYTTLELPDRRILIPNANLFTNSIIVYRNVPLPRDGEEE